MSDIAQARRGLGLCRGLCRGSCSSLAIALLACVLLGADAGGSQPRRPPSIVLIVADDIGYGDYGFMGSPVARTPHLDRLASEGTVFRYGFTTASYCAPSLRSLLTGLHPIQLSQRLAELRRRRGLSSLAGFTPGESLRQITSLPRALARGGYVSFEAGKYWEASYELLGFTSGMSRAAGPGREAEALVAGYALGRTTLAPALDFIDANRDRPFFLWFAPQLPHQPHDAPERFVDLYRGRKLSEAELAYFANVSRLDDVVGQLLAHLEARGLSEETVVVYLGDNGWDASRSVPARGKGTPYELGYRTPIVLRGPVPAGVVRDELVSSLDLFPTLLALAGVPPVEPRSGRDLLAPPPPGGEAGRAVLFEAAFRPTRSAIAAGTAEIPGWLIRRDADWYYIRSASGRHELYDMRSDPDQKSDLADREPERVERFSAEVDAWYREMRAFRVPRPQERSRSEAGASPKQANAKRSPARSLTQDGVLGRQATQQRSQTAASGSRPSDPRR